MTVPQSTLKKGVSLFWNGLRTDPGVLCAFILSFLTGTKPAVITEVAEADLLNNLTSGKSFIRVGDGEAMILTGRDIHYQPYYPELRTTLRETINSYSPSSPYIIAVPLFALTETESALQSRGRLRIWRLFRVLFRRRFPQEPYADAVLFYHQGAFERIITPVLAGRHVIVVSNPKNLTPTTLSYLKRGTVRQSIIETPERDAYHQLTDIKTRIDTVLNEHPDERPLILLAAGPTGKILAYQYAKAGVQCIDVGHGIEILGTTHDYSDRL